jgi:hypothetical protein
MSAEGDLWSDEFDQLIARIELRLEQYQLHAKALAPDSREREGVDALVKRMEERLVGLRLWQDKQRVC